MPHKENIELISSNNNNASNTPSPQRTPVLRSLSGTDVQHKLLAALLSNNYNEFRTLICKYQPYYDIDYVYGDAQYRTILEVACLRSLERYVDLLLRMGQAVPSFINPFHMKTALHLTAENGNYSILQLLLHQNDVNINVQAIGGSTPLLSLVKTIEKKKDDSKYTEYLKCVRLLLEHNADVNIPNSSDAPPIYFAAKHANRQLVEILLKESKCQVDIDSYKDRTNHSARDLIATLNIPLPEYKNVGFQAHIGVIKLFNLLKQDNVPEFKKCWAKCVEKIGPDELANSTNGLETLLQLATERGHEEVVKLLLKNQAKVNAVTVQNPFRPIEIACEKGFFSILAVLLSNCHVRLPPNLLHLVVKYINTNKWKRNDCNYKLCFDMLVSDARVNINALDSKGSTALHYATRNNDTESILGLLRRGACIYVKNCFDVSAISDISARTFETFLNECVETNNERSSSENYEVIFRYDFLLADTNPLDTHYDDIQMDDDNHSQNSALSGNAPYEKIDMELPTVRLRAEIEPLRHISENPELRHLLKHPVLTSFLYLKWNRISWIFNLNLLFYVIFSFSLITYILFGYGQINSDSFVCSFTKVMKVILACTVVCLIFREFLQCITCPQNYFTNLDNWFEIPLIGITIHMLIHEPGERMRQQLSAVAILMCAAELVLLIGNHPRLSTYVVILRTVSWNFFKFLLWYSILIVAFALSFFTLFRKGGMDEDGNFSSGNSSVVDDGKSEEIDFFVDPANSLFKTIVMLTGEFDASAINFNTFPVTSRLIFITFVFIIAIVLFNLLNGLAVSDTQMIKNDAELVGHIHRIELITYFENIVFGNVSPILRFIHHRIYCADSRNIVCLKWLARKISLYPVFLCDKQVIVKPNQGNLIVTNDKLQPGYPKHPVLCCCFQTFNSIGSFDEDMDESTEMRNRGCFDMCMHAAVMKDAKLILARKDDVSEMDEVKRELSCVRIKLDMLLELVQKLPKDDGSEVAGNSDHTQELS